MKGGEEVKTVEEREDEERAAEARERARRQELERARQERQRARQEQLERARHNEIAADRATQYHQRDRDNSWSFPFPCTILGGRIKNIFRKKNKSNKNKSKRIKKNKRYSRKYLRKSLKNIKSKLKINKIMNKQKLI